jgi:hypothetical protein
LFVEYYLGKSNWNATDAARRAGYADPELSGWLNRQNEVIAEAISRRIAAVAMDADECLMRIGRFARGTLKPFLTEVDGEMWPDLNSDQANENFDLLKKIKPKKRIGGPPEDKWTEIEIELEIHDPLRSLELIGRHHKLFTDKTEVSGPGGEPVKYEDVTPYRRMERAELNRGIEQALKNPADGES